ncbi:hypothetical protein [Alteribacter populi]|nr:hypothetical protein [Alteribacter populi]
MKKVSLIVGVGFFVLSTLLFLWLQSPYPYLAGLFVALVAF